MNSVIAVIEWLLRRVIVFEIVTLILLWVIR